MDAEIQSFQQTCKTLNDTPMTKLFDRSFVCSVYVPDELYQQDTWSDMDITLPCCRYDSGCQDVTNIDFSKLVIAAMMRKNLRQRPRMKWKVADMTALQANFLLQRSFKGKANSRHSMLMAINAFEIQQALFQPFGQLCKRVQSSRCQDTELLQFSEASFDNVLDKGGLDALMGEDSDESSAAGQKLLDGVSRVISPGGAYLCITLAQSHVLREPLFGRESKATIIIEHKSKGCLTIDNPPAGTDISLSNLCWIEKSALICISYTSMEVRLCELDVKHALSELPLAAQI